LTPGAPEPIGQHLLPEELQGPTEFLDSRRFQKVAQSVTELDFVSIVYNLSIKVEIRAPH